MRTADSLLKTLVTASLALGTAALSGQDYPSRPIRIVTSDAGGGSDTVSRTFSPALAVNLGQSVIIENYPSGVIPGNVVTKANPDGYTLLYYSSTFWTVPLFTNPKATPYDAEKDFAPISLMLTSPSLLVVTPSLPVNSVKELIALAKAKPGELNYATTAPGNGGHIATELLKSLAGVNIVRITYSGSLLGITEVMTGQVQMQMAPMTAIPFVKSGKLKALAITSAKPSALFPGLPTVVSSVPGFEYTSTSGMFGPPATPAPVIKRLNMEIVRVLNQPDVKAKLFNLAQEVIGGSPEQLSAQIRSELTKVRKVIKDTDIKIN